MNKSCITESEALAILETNDKNELDAIFKRSAKIRDEFTGKHVELCSIVNARCGGCPEDCSFCAQSAHGNAEVNFHSLISVDEMVNAARDAKKNGAALFSIVTSGRAVNAEQDLAVICDAVKIISKELQLKVCASLGLLNKASLQKLKDAGLTRYHNNLETARSYFSTICSTRSYDQQLETIYAAREIGIDVCCGGIFGMGESLAQRVELLFTISELDVDSVPINFLTPIPGTKLENLDELTPLDCLKIIAIARLIMPQRHIRLCGGREANLKEFNNKLFDAGADGVMIGNYLVTMGSSVDDDLIMMKKAGMTF